MLDAADLCPLTPGPAASAGCPDTDGDTVPDGVDKCPTAMGKPQNNGCPVYKQVVVTEERIEIKQKIFFAFGKTNILPKSFPLLDEVAKALQDHSTLCARVSGHTDSVGKREANFALSDGRAASVRTYLLGQGLAPERLQSAGYGSEQPLETNATPEGRERNRRVEFDIIGCPEKPK